MCIRSIEEHPSSGVPMGEENNPFAILGEEGPDDIGGLQLRSVVGVCGEFLQGNLCSEGCELLAKVGCALLVRIGVGHAWTEFALPHHILESGIF